MARPCDKPLKQNPFNAYRDPETGKWVVVKSQPQAPSRMAA